MPIKHRGGIDYRFSDGAFQALNPLETVQMYHVYECEVSRAKPFQADDLDSKKVLLLCTSGEGELRYGNASYPVTSSTLLFLPSGQFRLTTSLDQGVCRCVYIAFDILLKNMPVGGDFASVLSFFSVQDSALYSRKAETCMPLFSSFMAELYLPRPTLLLLKGYMYQILVSAYRYFADCSSDSLDAIDIHAVGHTVYAIICYIDDHLFTMNNLMEMAQELGYSYNYLSHLFRRKTGMTIQMYVSRKKIEQSTKMLAEDQYSITEIASKLNYDCIQSFSKAFRRAMGMSPTEFRALHGVSDHN